MRLIFGAFCACAAATAAAESWDLTTLRIVLPERPNAFQRAGAEELEKHLALITGVKPSGTGHELVFAPPPGAAPVKEFESFCRVENGKVYFWGDDGQRRFGSQFAVYAFLNRRLGVDWAYPGDDGIVFRRMKSVEMPDRWEDRFSPPLTQSVVRNYYGPPKIVEKENTVPPELRIGLDGARARIADNARWFLRRRLLTRDKIPYGHAFLDWQDRFLKTHPEFLCQPKADSPERGLPRDRNGFKYGKLCVSCEGVVDQIVADWMKRGKPKYLNLCENDGRGYCRCAACCALDAPLSADEPFDAHKTDRYLNFWNRVCGKVRAIRPDVVCTAYIYSDYRHPPRREKVAYPENMFFGIVPSLTDDYRADYAAWRKAGMRHFFLRPNFHAYWGVLPRGCEKAIYDNFQTSREFGIVGVDYDGYPGRYATQPDYYVTARMIAEPDGRFEDFMRDFCAAYGEAADVAGEYFARLRARGERKLNEIRDSRGKAPSDGTYDHRTSIHTVAELEADVAFLARAAGKGIPFREPECRRRFGELVVRARHAVLAQRFYDAAKAKDAKLREKTGWALLAFRREHAAELPDFYANLFGGTFACGEAWAWRGSVAYRAAMGDVKVPAGGPSEGWCCPFDNGALGWWCPRNAFGGFVTNGCGAAGSRGAFWLKPAKREPLGVSAQIPLDPGARYRYSAAFRAEGDVKSAGLRVLYPKGKGGSAKPATHRTFGDIGPEWGVRSVEIEVPADVENAMFYVYTGDGGENARLWCDDVTLEKISAGGKK